MLEQALAYARAAVAVLPLRGKVPLAEHGKDDATTDPDVIREWWRQWPHANIGLRPPRGVIVLDIDPRNGGALESLGEVTETRTARTGSGGWHLWFRYPHPVRGRVAGVSGVDIKTNTGYVVAPPSIHPDTKQRYRWITNAPIQPLPHSLQSSVNASETPPRKTIEITAAHGNSGLARRVSKAQTGERNNVLFWALACAYEEGANPEVLAAIVDAARGIGLSDNEITRTLYSAERRR